MFHSYVVSHAVGAFSFCFFCVSEWQLWSGQRLFFLLHTHTVIQTLCFVKRNWLKWKKQHKNWLWMWIFLELKHWTKLSFKIRRHQLKNKIMKNNVRHRDGHVFILYFEFFFLFFFSREFLLLLLLVFFPSLCLFVHLCYNDKIILFQIAEQFGFWPGIVNDLKLPQTHLKSCRPRCVLKEFKIPPFL